MSQLSEFMQSAYKSAAVTIGAKPFIVGSGKAIDVINAEAQYEREWEQHGFDSEATLTIVCSTIDFQLYYTLTPVDYHGKACTVGGVDWKIGTLSVGDEFTTINLMSMIESG